MDHAAQSLMEEYPDIVLGFGESDEYRLPTLNSRRLLLTPTQLSPS